MIRRFDTRSIRPAAWRSLADNSHRADGDARGAELAFASPADVAIAANGDLYVADSENHRICRIERGSGKMITVAGYGLGGFDGDEVQATQTALNWPTPYQRTGTATFTSRTP